MGFEIATKRSVEGVNSVTMQQRKIVLNPYVFGLATPLGEFPPSAQWRIQQFILGGPNQVLRPKVEGGARIEGTKRPSIDGGTRVKGAKRPRIGAKQEPMAEGEQEKGIGSEEEAV